MIIVATVLLQAAACIGLGSLILAILRVLDDFPDRERLPWAFAVGFGALGWIIFPVALTGWLSKEVFFVFELGLAGGCLLLISHPTMERPKLDTWGRILVATIAVAIAFDFLEALSPPADADSMAYHFARPRQILALGRVDFVPRAVDGAIPLLVQMTYVPVLALGGEKALTLWCMVSGAMPAYLLYAVARRWLDVNWSLAAALILLTTPAWVYGAGTGQVEARLSLFALTAAVALSMSFKKDALRYAALAGVVAGFYAGGKYLGLLFLLACGIVAICRTRWLIAGATFSAMAFIAGGQWYAWNLIHTGDPFFPMLFDWLGNKNSDFWSVEQHTYFKHVWAGAEIPGAPTLWGAITYPFRATFAGLPTWESSRTGFGPMGILTLPFATLGLWQRRSHLLQHPLLPISAITIIFYVLWFFSGSSQRIRHLLPIYPLFLICMIVAAQRGAAAMRICAPMTAAIITTILPQFGGHGLFTVKYARFLFGQESQESFLAQNVPNYDPVPWINANLGSNDRLLLTERQLIYLINIPVYYAHPELQALVDLRDGMPDDHRKRWHQLQKLGISHLLVIPSLTERGPGPALWRLADKLVSTKCAERVQSFTTRVFSSRTLPGIFEASSTAEIIKLLPDQCNPPLL